MDQYSFIGLGKLLELPNELAALMQYVRGKPEEQLCLFLIAAKKYAAEPREEMRKEQAAWMIENYFGSQHVAGVLPKPVVAAVKKAKSGPFTESIFDESYQAVYNIVYKDVLPGFLSSPLGTETPMAIALAMLPPAPAHPTLQEITALAEAKSEILIMEPLTVEYLKKAGTMVYRALCDQLYVYAASEPRPLLVVDNCWQKLKIEAWLVDEETVLTLDSRLVVRLKGAAERDTWLRTFRDYGITHQVTGSRAGSVEASLAKRDPGDWAKLMYRTMPSHEARQIKGDIVAALEKGGNEGVRLSNRTRSDTAIAQDCIVFRESLLEDMLTSERVFIERLEGCVEDVLQPVEDKKLISENILTQANFGAFVSACKQVIALHRRLLESFAKYRSEEAKFIACISYALDTGRKQVYLPFVQQWVGLSVELHEEPSSKLAAWMNEEEGRAVQLRETLRSPIIRLLQIVTLLERLLRHTPRSSPIIQQLLKTIATATYVATQVRDCHEQVEQSCELAYLDCKLTGIPDDWIVLTPTQGFQAKAVMTYIFGAGLDSDVPPESHPHKDKRGESVIVYLLKEWLLITTFQYKYRYRMELRALQVVRMHDLLVVVMSDMFNMQELIHGGDSSTTLLCRTRQERDRWAELLDNAIRAAKSLAIESSHVQRHSSAKLTSPVGSMARSVSQGRSGNLLSPPAAAGPMMVVAPAETKDGKDKKGLPAGIGLLRKTRSGSSDQLDIRRMDGKEELSVSRVNVYLRVRPFVSKEEKDIGESCLAVDGNIAALRIHGENQSRPDRISVYDDIFGPEDGQLEVFNGIGQEVLGAVISGYNVAVLAYGNTGAGKTYTTFGDPSTPKQRGLVPRLLQSMFEIFQSRFYKGFQVKVSYLQVYNDKIQDLQGPAELPGLSFKQTSKGGSVKGLKEVQVKNWEEALGCIDKGNQLRTTRSHKMNDYSSRSHAVFIVQVRAQKVQDPKPQNFSVYLIDLAGSENVSMTGVVGEALEEAKHINKSLITLGRVINALNENRRRTKGKQLPVPFRETKLTQLLTDVLTGNFICSLILNASCSPAMGQAAETAKTMAFGEGAKKLGALGLGPGGGGGGTLTTPVGGGAGGGGVGGGAGGVGKDDNLNMWLAGVYQAFAKNSALPQSS